MVNRRANNTILLSALLLSGCSSFYSTSLKMGYYSATTGKPLWPAAYYVPEELPIEQNGIVPYKISAENRIVPNPVPFYDSKVIFYSSGLKLCRDTFRLPDLNNPERKGIIMAPGGVIFNKAGLAIDEAEISNLDWRLFVAENSSANEIAASMLPDTSALPIKDYYTSPFYAYYPVVGISYEQAKQYCAWRTEVVNNEFATSSYQYVKNTVCEYRLPTENEWEEAAELYSGLPFGTNCTELPVRVAEGAAAYLQKRANISVSISQIKADITVYNKKRPVRSWINYAQSEPYFLRLATPGYIYQGPANNLGLYQMLGNAAEMIAERGVTKGGSYRDDLEACRIKARGHFNGPSSTVGLRCVCKVWRVK